MYAAPRTIETHIFATLPEDFASGPVDQLSKFVDGEFDSFLEGPSFDRRGNLYCVDLVFGRIFGWTRKVNSDSLCSMTGSRTA